MENDGTAEDVVGQRVRELRLKRGWSQSELGKQLARFGFDMTQGTVAKLESGRRPIRLNEVVALSEILGVPVFDLIPAHSEMQVSELEELAREQIELSARIRELKVACEEAEYRLAAVTAARMEMRNELFETTNRHAEVQRLIATLRG